MIDAYFHYQSSAQGIVRPFVAVPAVAKILTLTVVVCNEDSHQCEEADDICERRDWERPNKIEFYFMLFSCIFYYLCPVAELCPSFLRMSGAC